MIFGGLIGIAGIFFPWYILFYPVAHGEHSELVNGPKLEHNAVVVHDALTLNGVHASEVAIAIAIVTALLQRLGDVPFLRRRMMWARPAEGGPPRIVAWASSIPAGVSFYAIVSFVSNQWAANVHNGYEESIRENVYYANGGGHRGLELAASISVYPLGGFFILCIGLALAWVGLYSRTAPDWKEPEQKNASPRRVPSTAVSVARGTVILGVLVAVWLFSIGQVRFL